VEDSSSLRGTEAPRGTGPGAVWDGSSGSPEWATVRDGGTAEDGSGSVAEWGGRTAARCEAELGICFFYERGGRERRTKRSEMSCSKDGRPRLSVSDLSAIPFFPRQYTSETVET
jgi:hypothetical protein